MSSPAWVVFIAFSRKIDILTSGPGQEQVMSEDPVRADFEAARNLLRKDILSGALEPNSKLKIRELTARYGISASPMREALSQLAATGIVQQQAQRGFRVPPVSAEELLDITASRQIIETEALRLAIKNANAPWEDEIVASFHVFEREITRFYGTRERDFDAYEMQHRRFHTALIAACPLQALKEFCDELYMRATRYRRLTRSYGFKKDAVIAEHRILMEAVLAAQPRRAVEALRAHIGLTADVILKMLGKAG
jgi:GntR family carbon starvation induced transcriptional regulator